MIKSHGPGSRGLHVVGNFYPLSDGQKASGVPTLRTTDVSGKLPRHISSQPTLYIIGDQNGPMTTLEINTKGSILQFKAPAFQKGTVAFATGNTALFDAKNARDNAFTPGHRNRAQARIDMIEDTIEYAAAPNALWYIGNNGHLYASITSLAPGAVMLPVNEVKQLRDTLLPHLEPITVKDKDITSDVLDAILARGLVDVDAFVSELYPDVDAGLAAQAADKILDSAALFQYIRGLGESSETIGEYLDGYLTDAALVRERAIAFGVDAKIISNYERSMNMGEACAKLADVPLTRTECWQLHMLIEDSLVGRYTISQETRSSFYDVGDLLLLPQPFDVSVNERSVTLKFRSFTSVALFDTSYAECDFVKLRDCFRKAITSAYKFMFASDNPLLFTWAQLGSIYFSPAVKG